MIQLRRIIMRARCKRISAAVGADVDVHILPYQIGERDEGVRVSIVIFLFWRVKKTILFFELSLKPFFVNGKKTSTQFCRCKQREQFFCVFIFV